MNQKYHLARSDVFGAVRMQTRSSDNDWLFTGEQHDADSDLYFLRARYYDPGTGAVPVAGPPTVASAQPFKRQGMINI